VRTDIEASLSMLTDSYEKEDLSYYLGADFFVQELSFNNTDKDMQYAIEIMPNESVEFCFECNYPWISERNVSAPPSGALAFIRIDKGRGNRFFIESDFPLVEIEIVADEDNCEIRVDGKFATNSNQGELVRLSRFLNSRNKVVVTSNRVVKLASIAQCSALQFYRYTDGFVFIRSPTDSKWDISMDIHLD
jgi:hypothetical protein